MLLISNSRSNKKNRFFVFCFLPVVDCIFSFFFGSPYLAKTRLSTGNATFLYSKMFYTLIKKKPAPRRGRKKHVFLHKNLDVLCLHQEINRNRRNSCFYSSYSSLQWWQLVRVMGGPGWPWVALPWEALGSPGKPWEALGSLGKPWEALGSPGKPWEALGSPGPYALCPVPWALCPVPCALCPVQLSSCRV